MSSGTTLLLTSGVQRTPQITFSQLDDEWLAIDSEAGYCYSLNASAGQIWELISEPATVQAICLELCRRFAVDQATCERDVSEVLQQMLALGVVRVVPGTP